MCGLNIDQPRDAFAPVHALLCAEPDSHGIHYTLGCIEERGLQRGAAIKHLIQHFRRYGRVWVCIDPVTLDGPQGQIQVAPGTTLESGKKFMNVDLAQLLDDERTREECRPEGAGDQRRYRASASSKRRMFFSTS